MSPVHITVSLNDKASSNMVGSSLKNVAVSTDGGLNEHKMAIRPSEPRFGTRTNESP